MFELSQPSGLASSCCRPVVNLLLLIFWELILKLLLKTNPQVRKELDLKNTVGALA